MFDKCPGGGGLGGGWAPLKLIKPLPNKEFKFPVLIKLKVNLMSALFFLSPIYWGDGVIFCFEME